MPGTCPRSVAWPNTAFHHTLPKWIMSGDHALTKSAGMPPPAATPSGQWPDAGAAPWAGTPAPAPPAPPAADPAPGTGPAGGAPRRAPAALRGRAASGGRAGRAAESRLRQAGRATDPKSLEIEAITPEGNKYFMTGIYAFAGEQLRLGWNGSGHGRPTSFKTNAQTTGFSFLLKRAAE